MKPTRTTAAGKKPRWALAIASGLALFMAGSLANAATVTVGGANFSEQTVLANLYAAALRKEGFDVKMRLNLGNRQIIAKAMETGEVDVVPEYLGALLAFYDGNNTLTDAGQIEEALKPHLGKNLVLLDPAPAGSIDAWAVKKKTAEKYHLANMSDLAPIAKDLVVGGPPEVKTNALGLPGLKKVYGIEFKSMKSLDMGGPLTRLALNSGAIDVATVVSTQGILATEDWVVLKDDRHQQPPQNVVPEVRTAVLNDQLAKALNAVSSKLTDEQLIALNRQVEIDHKDAAKVAEQWVSTHLQAP